MDVRNNRDTRASRGPTDIRGREGVHRSQRNQYAAVTDLLAHGEIYGLVGGMSGVFFNETPLAPTPASGDQSSSLSVIVTTGHQSNYLIRVRFLKVKLL